MPRLLVLKEAPILRIKMLRSVIVLFLFSNPLHDGLSLYS
jgi:hypothetical protein